MRFDLYAPFHTVKKVLFLLIILPGSLPLQAQEVSRLMLEQLLADSSIRAEIMLHHSMKTEPFMFSKENPGANELLPLVDNMLVNHHGVFLGIAATERIYRALPAGKEIRLQRLDSTQRDGHLQQAYVFTWQDTLFALGG